MTLSINVYLGPSSATGKGWGGGKELDHRPSPKGFLIGLERKCVHEQAVLPTFLEAWEVQSTVLETRGHKTNSLLAPQETPHSPST